MSSNQPRFEEGAITAIEVAVRSNIEIIREYTQRVYQVGEYTPPWLSGASS